MKRHGVVITGMGAICSAGGDCAAFSHTLEQGKTSLFYVTDPRIAHYGSVYAGLIPDDTVERLPLADEDRFIRLADAAMNEAIAHAGIDFTACGPRSGLFFGTCSGPMLTIEETYGADGHRNATADRMLLQKKQYYRAANLLARRYHIKGPVYTTTTACSAFCTALATAADFIRLNLIEAAIVGGSDSFSLTTLAGFVGLKAVSSSPCAPFSMPMGLNLGEGAAAVVLEQFDRAEKRAARIIAVIEGYGLSNDAYHCSAPDPTGKGATAAMAGALRDALVSAKEVTYINAHGTGTEANDKAETRAIKRLFSESDGMPPPVSSTKAVVGHCLGAAGAIEMVAALLCAQKGILPSTGNYSGRREGCPLDYIIENARSWREGGRWIKNSFAFGGNNASIVVKNGTVDSASVNSAGILDEPVAISAAGVLSAAGVAPIELTEAYFSSVSAPAQRKITGQGIWPVRGVPPFNVSEIDRRISLRGMDRAGMLATSAAALALKSGRIADRTSSRSAIGFFMNIAQGSTWAEREHIGRLLKNNFHIEQINPFPYIVPNAVNGTAARALSLTGYNTTFCNGPGAGLFGLVASWAAVKNRHAGALLCGSVDDLTEEGLYDCVSSEQEGETRPVLGEGAVMLLLEPLSFTQARGVEPLGMILGCAFADIVAGSTGGHVVNVIESLMQDHGIGRDQTVELCSYDVRYRFSTVAQEMERGVVLIDQIPLTGWMPASQPLFDMLAALVRGRVGTQKCAKYILIILCSPQGKIVIVLIEKNIERKS